jgi:hypothetical protein
MSKSSQKRRWQLRPRFSEEEGEGRGGGGREERRGEETVSALFT